MGAVGKVRTPVAVILLTLVTLGIYGLYWQYATFKEMKESSGQGIGGPLGLVIAIFIGIVNCFIMPSEIANLYKARGKDAGISAITGLWVLIPLLGWIIWVVKVQGHLNEYWEETPPVSEGFATPTA